MNETPQLQLQAQSAYAPLDASSMSAPARSRFIQEYANDRYRGRTDIIWLCNNVLQYRDVSVDVHGPVANHIQQFLGRQEIINPNTFEIKFSEPYCAKHTVDDNCDSSCIGRTCWYLPGARFRMLLDPRGHLKTTVNTIAHSIQWILNFEDIRIALSTATVSQGADIITEVENQFRFNARLRFLYPEFCPPADRVSDWGSKDQFTVLNRRRKWLKEPTMRVVSIGKVVAGPHYEVMKHSDLVDKENVKTPAGISEVKEHFKYTMPLLERGPVIPGRGLTRGWIDLEGTIYDFSDLYCEELDKDEKRVKNNESCRWSVLRRDAIADTLSIEEEENGINWKKPRHTLWESRFPWAELAAIYEDIGEYLFNCQYRLRPKARGMGLISAAEIGYFPSRFKKIIFPRCYMKTTVDFAGAEEDPDACNSAIVTVGHLPDGRKMVFEALVGRPTSLEISNYLFDLDYRFSTLTRKLVIQMEKAHHAQASLPFIYREMETRKQYLNIVAIPRDTNVSKDNRILYGLQTWFKKRLIWFSDDIPCLPHIVSEITKFPKFKFKDFLDALADQGQTKDGKVDEQTAVPIMRDQAEDPLKLAGHRFVGFNPVTKQPAYSDDNPDLEAVFGSSIDEDRFRHDSIVGAL